MNAPSPHVPIMTPDQWDKRYPLVASNVFRNVATLGAVLIGFVGLGFQGYLSNVSNAQQAIQLEAQTYLTREMKYDDMWTGYMELALEYPEFAEGADYKSLSPEDKIRYTWFFDRLAYTAEAILSLRHDDAKWREIFEGEFNKHGALLRDHPGIIRDWFCNYDDSVRPLMKDAIRGSGRAVPDCAAKKKGASGNA